MGAPEDETQGTDPDHLIDDAAAPDRKNIRYRNPNSRKCIMGFLFKRARRIF